ESVSTRLHVPTESGRVRSFEIANCDFRNGRKGQLIANCDEFEEHRGTAYRPYAFTEHGALQAANVLRSQRAVQMSVFVIRAFVKMREHLAPNHCDPSAIDRVRADIDCYHDISFKVDDYAQLRFDLNRVTRAAL